MATLIPGSWAPDFALPGIDGRTYSLAKALRRGPTVLAFAKSECGACALALPYLDRLHRAYVNAGCQLLGILQDSPEDAQAFARTHRLQFPVLIDAEPWPVSRAYDPESTPTLFLVEPNGTIAWVSAGFRKAELNGLSTEMARRLDVAPAEIAPADDGTPAFQPG